MQMEARVIGKYNIGKFMAVVDNYNLYTQPKLLKYAVRACLSYDSYDPDTCLVYCKKFDDIVAVLELYGCTDITDPIHCVETYAQTDLQQQKQQSDDETYDSY